MYLLYTVPAFAITPWETQPRFMFEADWDGDGLFANAYSNLNSRIASPVSTIRGRDEASSLIGRSIAGHAATKLRNYDGLFSSYNASSPLAGKLLPNRKIRAWSLTPHTYVLWTGVVDSIDPSSADGEPEPFASLIASGIFRVLGDQTHLVSPPSVTDGLTSDVLEAVLDEANVAGSVEAGVVPVGNWYVPAGGRVALELSQEIWDETELGFLREGLAWDVVGENRYHRLLNSQVSSAVFSDAPGSSFPYLSIVQEPALREIYNDIAATVHTWEEQVTSELWKLVDVGASVGEAIYMAPGESRQFKAVNTEGYVDPWTTPVVGLHVVSPTGTLVVSDVHKGAQEMTFTITNTHATQAAEIEYLVADGIKYEQVGEEFIVADDLASQALYGKRSYPLPSPWWNGEPYAQAAADLVISRQKDPHPVIAMTFSGSISGPLAALAASLDLSDRITVTANALLTLLGLATVDFFIESIAHTFGPGMPHETTLLLSPAGAVEYFWILGDATYGVLGTTTRLAY